jgi:hypothetical protein
VWGDFRSGSQSKTKRVAKSITVNSPLASKSISLLPNLKRLPHHTICNTNMATKDTSTADLQGGPVRPYSEPLRQSSYQLRILLGVQIVLSVVVLSIALNLIATLPEGAAAPTAISLLVFVTIFSVLSWFYIFVIAQHVPEKFHPKVSSIVFGSLGFIFYFVGSLVLTVAIAPAQGCDNQEYVNKNKLLAGSGGLRCRLVEANIAISWVGTPPSL